MWTYIITLYDLEQHGHIWQSDIGLPTLQVSKGIVFLLIVGTISHDAGLDYISADECILYNIGVLQ